MNYSELYKKLKEQGYYIGSFDDFFQEEHDGITKEKFDLAVAFFKTTLDCIEIHSGYRHNYTQQFSQEYLQNDNYTGPKPSEEELLHTVPYSRREIRKKFVENAIAGGADIRTTQQWTLVGYVNGADMCETFNTFTKSYISKIYESLAPHKENLILDAQYSIYKKGDFSELHYDGVRKTRTCAIIYYFADPKTWNGSDSGGRLIIEKHHKHSHNLQNDPKLLEQFIAENNELLDMAHPIYGTYVILDLIDNNCGHAIEKVKDDFIRFALITFVGLPEI